MTPPPKEPLLTTPPDHEHEHEHEHEHHHHHEPLDYGDAVRAFRAEKDGFLGTDPRSPIPEPERAAFQGLPYYPIDEGLRFEALKLDPYAGDEPTSFTIPTSDGKLRPADRAGTFRFTIGSVACALTGYALEHDPSGSVFVPFLDATSGTETYGAGRYLDLEPEEDGTYTLDFNLAYHPSCVFDAKYSCPLTPAENRLPVRIEAGERLAEQG